MSCFINYNFFNPKLKLLSDRYDSIKEEYLLNRDKLEFKDFTVQQDKNIQKFGKGYPIGVESYFSAPPKGEKKGWHMAGISYDNYVYGRNANHMPVLTQTLREIADLNVCGINVLDPGMSLNWHNDDDYQSGIPTLRTLWGLEVPFEEGKEAIIQMKDNLTGQVETRAFKENEFICFWPATEHRVENNLSVPRAIIAIDLLINP